VQWSEGRQDWKPPHGLVSGEVMLKQTVNPDPGYARKELFFTVNGDNIYAIAPVLPEGKLLIKGVTPSAGTKVQLLGLQRDLPFKKVNGGIEVTVPKLSVKETPCEHAFTFRITKAG
jgi:alpha-L-fucosidase